MLKIATESEEKFGGVLMTWWEGQGAASVLAMHGDAILLERAGGERSLSEFARNGRDAEATRIICDVIAELHAPRAKPLPELIPLAVWFRELEPAAATHGGILTRSAETARFLLAEPRDPGVLHGDIHHDNILDFGERGWLAIDPKRLFGERGFDYANLFCNQTSATHCIRWPPCQTGSGSGWRSSPSGRVSSVGVFCSGLSPGADCRPPGSSATVKARRSTCALRSWRSPSSKASLAIKVARAAAIGQQFRFDSRRGARFLPAKSRP